MISDLYTACKLGFPQPVKSTDWEDLALPLQWGTPVPSHTELLFSPLLLALLRVEKMMLNILRTLLGSESQPRVRIIFGFDAGDAPKMTQATWQERTTN
jgi:hypothetical protein